MITSDLVLMNYDPEVPLLLACDASSYGLGAVLSHKLSNGTERPIAFASRSLNSAERNYSQIDKEALGLVWGVKKFNSYLYGNHFTLVTDHKPLLSILSPRKGVNATTGARLQRYALFLAGYTYDIQFKSTTSHGNCDSLSRLPLKETEIHHLDATDAYIDFLIETLPVTCSQVAAATRRDPNLSQILEYVQKGWTGMNNVKPELKVYFNRQDELTLHQGCLLWGSRVVIPENLQKSVLEELHTGHLGLQKMKSVARSYVWWPTLDNDIDVVTKSCSGCMSTRSAPPEAPIHPWEFPQKPWSRVHIDFAGPFLGHMYFVMVDAYSKWPVVKVMNRTTSSMTIEIMRSTFADFGLCDEIVSDNGPQFVSDEFKEFLAKNGIKHITSAPYHPKTNGLAERFVQSMKQALKAAKHDNGTIQTKLSRFMMQYRNSEHATTKETPSRLFLGRCNTTRLDKLKPDLRQRVESQQRKMVRSENHRNFDIGQDVAIRDYRKDHEKRIHGKVQRQTGPVSYRVEVAPNMTWKRHSDQIHESAEGVPVNRDNPGVTQEPCADKPALTIESPLSIEPTRRYPIRERKKPDRLDL